MPKFDTVINILLVTAALAVAAVVVRRELRDGSTRSQPTKPEKVRNWEKLVDDGILMGAASDPIKMLIFADVECPYCRNFDNHARAALAASETPVAMVLMHYPLPSHPDAIPGARALECADKQGGADGLMHAIYDRQDSIGEVTWQEFARAAGTIPDLPAFDSCVAGAEVFPRITRGKTLGDSIGVLGTPTVIVNGWRLPSPPDSTQLSAVIADIAAGRAPRWTSR